MFDAIIDALKDTINIIPWLLIIYIIIEIIESRWSKKVRILVQKSGSAGPVMGALGGSLPQCGFSVVGATLYNQRLITIGTLTAIFLATSDEAIPVILSHPEKAMIIAPLILTKIFVAIIAGYSIDYVFRKKNKKILSHIKEHQSKKDSSRHHHEEALSEASACCGHNPNPSVKSIDVKKLLWHPVVHTTKIAFFIFMITLLINLAILWIGEDSFANLFAGNTLIQPFITALVGLLPNCASSVAITELYLEGAITYGAVISGLCAGGGLGLLILFKEGHDKKSVIRIIALLYGISVFVGLIIQLFNISPSL